MYMNNDWGTWPVRRLATWVLRNKELVVGDIDLASASAKAFASAIASALATHEAASTQICTWAQATPRASSCTCASTSLTSTSATITAVPLASRRSLLCFGYGGRACQNDPGHKRQHALGGFLEEGSAGLHLVVLLVLFILVHDDLRIKVLSYSLPRIDNR